MVAIRVTKPNVPPSRSGENDQRPKLVTAINRCWLTGATLLVAKLDRLSRDAAFLMSLSKSGIDIRACDLPEANTMMFGIMAVIAQHETLGKHLPPV
jgi:DNA invertase Pin-like site-specific DNA recombinase